MNKLLSIFMVIGSIVGSMALSSLSLAAIGDKPLENVELLWRPTDDIDDIKKVLQPEFQGKKFHLLKIEDQRPADQIKKIGANKEKPGKEFLVTTENDVIAFIQMNLTKVLGQVSVDLDEKNAGYTIRAKVKDFFVEENPSYRGSLVMSVEVSKGPKVLWQGVVSGTNKRFGRSYSYNNYMESLSDSIMDFAKHLVSNKTLASKL
jgi:hypothetical protein